MRSTAQKGKSSTHRWLPSKPVNASSTYIKLNHSPIITSFHFHFPITPPLPLSLDFLVPLGTSGNWVFLSFTIFNISTLNKLRFDFPTCFLSGFCLLGKRNGCKSSYPFFLSLRNGKSIFCGLWYVRFGVLMRPKICCFNGMCFWNLSSCFQFSIYCIEICYCWLVDFGFGLCDLFCDEEDHKIL